jgi:large subunit ribosomal protein L25
MAETAEKLELRPRDVEGSRATRRLRREGLVPGIIYGGDGDCVPFAVDARILRNALAHAHAVIEIEMDGGSAQPVMVKDIQRHPVRGDVVHLDLLRVNMSKPIQAPVALHVTGADDAPGVTEGGILTQELREIQIEALPGDIPDSLEFDVSHMEMNATATLAEFKPPAGITVLDDPETLVATITPPSQEVSDDEIETETGLVGQGTAAEAQAEGDTAEEAAQKAEASDDGGNADAS